MMLMFFLPRNVEESSWLVKNYIWYKGIWKKLEKLWRAISASVVIAAARGILLACDKNMLGEYGGYVELNKHWAYSLLIKWINYVRRKAKSKLSNHDFSELKKSFLADVTATGMMKDIPHKPISNWYQMGIHIVPSSTWIMEQCGAKSWSCWSRW